MHHAQENNGDNQDIMPEIDQVPDQHAPDKNGTRNACLLQVALGIYAITLENVLYINLY